MWRGTVRSISRSTVRSTRGWGQDSWARERPYKWFLNEQPGCQMVISQNPLSGWFVRNGRALVALSLFGFNGLALTQLEDTLDITFATFNKKHLALIRLWWFGKPQYLIMPFQNFGNPILFRWRRLGSDWTVESPLSIEWWCHCCLTIPWNGKL